MKPIWVVKIKQGEKLLFTTPAYFKRDQATDKKAQLEADKNVKAVIHKYEYTAAD